MDIECKSGRHFSDIEALKECSDHFTRCSSCISIPSVQTKPVLMFCPFCLEKSLYVYKNQDYYECMNGDCPNHHLKVAYRHEFILKIAIELQKTE